MKEKIKSNVKLYFHYLSVALRSTMQYKTSFYLMVTGRFLLFFNGILGVYFMFSRFGHVKGYTFGEVLLCFAIIQADFALAECIGSGFAAFAGIVRQGEFDRVLLRPRSTILQVLGSQFRIDFSGGFYVYIRCSHQSGGVDVWQDYDGLFHASWRNDAFCQLLLAAGGIHVFYIGWD